MRSTVLLSIIAAAILSSCGISIQKRLYREGYYIRFNPISPGSVTPETASASGTDTNCFTSGTADFIIAKTGAPATIFPDEVIAYVCANNDAAIPSASNDSSAASVAVQQDDPKKDEPGAEIASIGKLNKNGSAFLRCSLIAFPLAFLTLTAALILSIIALRKIQRLKRLQLSDAQNEEIAKQRKQAKKILIVSSILLALIITAGVLVILSSGITITNFPPLL